MGKGERFDARIINKLIDELPPLFAENDDFIQRHQFFLLLFLPLNSSFINSKAIQNSLKMQKNSPEIGGINFAIFIIFLSLIQQSNFLNVSNEPELVTPRALGGAMDFQQNLINAKKAFAEKKGRGRPRRRRIHSVSRSVNNSFRSQFDASNLVHRHWPGQFYEWADGGKRMVDSGETGAAEGVEKFERTVLTNEGIERAIILVPAAIDHPKVLTAQTFGGDGKKLKFKEAKTRKRQRIVKRVDGETNANKRGMGQRGKSTIVEEMEASKLGQKQQIPVNTTSVEMDILANDLNFSSVMAARLRRFNKANLLKGGPKNGRGKALVELIHEVGLFGHQNGHFKEKPQISFAIDDDRPNSLQKEGMEEGDQKLQRIYPSEEGGPIRIGQNGKGAPVSLRTKFPKNRETQRPIQLSRADDSDMDLLSPPFHHSGQDLLLKPVQRLSSSQISHRQQIAAAPNRNSPQPGIGPPPPSKHFVPIPPPISPSFPLQSTRPPPPSTPSPIGPSSPPPTTANSLSPNAKLELCCRRQNLPQTCQQFCNFDTFTQEKLLVALLGTQCPASQLGKAFDCAHSKVDHSECCQRHGIHLINDGQCMVFCRTHIPTPPNVLGYVSCLSQFGTIKNCYRDHQQKFRNLFGD